MKHFAALFLILTSCFIAHSQTYELGGTIVGANFIGDVGKTNYIAPNTLGFGGIFKWNRSPRHSFRASFIVANIEGDDVDSHETRRNQRGYSFQNTIKEMSLGLEYTFWDFSMYDGQSASTPYLYTGLTYFRYDALYKDEVTDEILQNDSVGSIAIPMVIGYKASAGTNLVLAFEIGARYTFTDAIDGNNPVKGLEEFDQLEFGNTNNNDWYVFTGITVTFAFGRKPCYCNF
ncbi:type IX secretion system protein PorG [Cochleicola gelatinilyticus]|uniref:DUF6089 domain-containing protein n=1 Tax=Cochleicola gelatinilyticus TaxID=1763537 RepID=A0A167KCC9_9FLAO|nr:DUF6089 family protein [Cochleicola gelatinilyticus]OAB81721.1 hypothetical protein ULVI_00625 [Cochleicola gelatinilyticus]